MRAPFGEKKRSGPSGTGNARKRNANSENKRNTGRKSTPKNKRLRRRKPKAEPTVLNESSNSARTPKRDGAASATQRTGAQRNTGLATSGTYAWTQAVE